MTSHLIDIGAVLSISGVANWAAAALESLVRVSAVDAGEAGVGVAARNRFVARNPVALETRRTRTATVTGVSVRATDTWSTEEEEEEEEARRR